MDCFECRQLREFDGDEAACWWTGAPRPSLSSSFLSHLLEKHSDDDDEKSSGCDRWLVLISHGQGLHSATSLSFVFPCLSPFHHYDMTEKSQQRLFYFGGDNLSWMFLFPFFFIGSSIPPHEKEIPGQAVPYHCTHIESKVCVAEEADGQGITSGGRDSSS